MFRKVFSIVWDQLPESAGDVCYYHTVFTSQVIQ